MVDQDDGKTKNWLSQHPILRIKQGKHDAAINGINLFKNTSYPVLIYYHISIARIVTIIEDIAFQSNLLALNASVEAARAGEQGRSFAVVAKEIGNLAQHCSISAKEIKDLVTRSIDSIKASNRLINESENTLAQIISSINTTAQVISDIHTASDSQVSSTDQMIVAITQMTEITEENAGLAQKGASASKQMQEQSNQLNQLVSLFKIE